VLKNDSNLRVQITNISRGSNYEEVFLSLMPPDLSMLESTNPYTDHTGYLNSAPRTNDASIGEGEASLDAMHEMLSQQYEEEAGDVDDSEDEDGETAIKIEEDEGEEDEEEGREEEEEEQDEQTDDRNGQSQKRQRFSSSRDALVLCMCGCDSTWPKILMVKCRKCGTRSLNKEHMPKWKCKKC